MTTFFSQSSALAKAKEAVDKSIETNDLDAFTRSLQSLKALKLDPNTQAYYTELLQNRIEHAWNVGDFALFQLSMQHLQQFKPQASLYLQHYRALDPDRFSMVLGVNGPTQANIEQLVSQINMQPHDLMKMLGVKNTEQTRGQFDKAYQRKQAEAETLEATQNNEHRTTPVPKGPKLGKAEEMEDKFRELLNLSSAPGTSI